MKFTHTTQSNAPGSSVSIPSFDHSSEYIIDTGDSNEVQNGPSTDKDLPAQERSKLVTIKPGPSTYSFPVIIDVSTKKPIARVLYEAKHRLISPKCPSLPPVIAVPSQHSVVSSSKHGKLGKFKALPGKSVMLKTGMFGFTFEKSKISARPFESSRPPTFSHAKNSMRIPTTAIYHVHRNAIETKRQRRNKITEYRLILGDVMKQIEDIENSIKEFLDFFSQK